MSDDESPEPRFDAGDRLSNIRKLSSPYEESNWNTWHFAILMMLSGRNLIYVVDSSMKMGFTKDKPPSAEERAFDNIKVASIIAGRVHEDNFKLIDSHCTDASAMMSALREAHQNCTAGGKFLYLREMMSTRTLENDDLLKYLNRMETLQAALASICTDGRISIDDLYVSAVIIGLPDT